MKTTAIIGAGPTGLSAAYALHKNGHAVTVFEKNPHIGGAVRTSIEDGYLTELGPNTLMLNDLRIQNLIKELGIENEIIEADHSSAKRFVIKGGKPVALPSSPKNLLSSKAISFTAKLRLLREPFLKKYSGEADESFADFVRRRLGKQMLDYAAGPFVSGIYAGDAEKLSFRHAFPRLHKIEQAHSSIIKGFIKQKKLAKQGKGDSNNLAKRKIISFKNGMQTLPTAIANTLPRDSILTETNITKIEQIKGDQPQWQITWQDKSGNEQNQILENIIIASPAHTLDQLGLPNEIISQLTQTTGIYHPPVASVLLGYKKEQITHPLDGFGMLASLPEKSPVLGALFTSTLFPNRAPDGHVTINVMIGGALTPELALKEENELIENAHGELNKLLGISGSPTYQKLTVWKKAIPQANLGYQAVLDELNQVETTFPGLHLAGNYRGGISLPDSILNGLELGYSL